MFQRVFSVVLFLSCFSIYAHAQEGVNTPVRIEEVVEVVPTAEAENALGGIGLTTEFQIPTDENLLRLTGLLQKYPMIGKNIISFAQKGKRTVVFGIYPSSGLVAGLDVPLGKRISFIPTLVVPMPGHYGAGTVAGYKIFSKFIETRAVVGFETVRNEKNIAAVFRQQNIWRAGVRFSKTIAPLPLTVGDSSLDPNNWKAFVGYWAELSYQHRNSLLYDGVRKLNFDEKSFRFGGFWNVGKVHVRLAKPMSQVVSDLRRDWAAEMAKPKKTLRCAEQQPIERAMLCKSDGWDDEIKLQPRLSVPKKLRLAQWALLIAAAYSSYEVGRGVERLSSPHVTTNMARAVGIGLGAIHFSFGFGLAKENRRTYMVGYPSGSRYLDALAWTSLFATEGRIISGNLK